MFHKASTFMETFSSQHANSAKMVHRDDSVFLSIESPLTLAAFFAFCSGQSIDTRVYLRGCTENYETAYPSLFRELPDDDFVREQKKRWDAYKYVLHNLQDIKGGRWRRKDLGAVLQHYGIKTPWFDVVRNLYSAIWFATHELRNSGPDGVAKPTGNDYGWISFYRRKAWPTKKCLRVKDLSAHHSSTHLRPHAQHGGSLAMQMDEVDTPYPCQDFNRFRIGQIRIPYGTKWRLSGHMVSSAFMFPPRDLDESLCRLSIPAVQDILDDACTKFNMGSGSLGKISSYR